MTIVQIEYLLAVAACGSFSQASEKCFVTQPSLSTQIRNLEEELGVVLLNRNEKPVALTEAGRVVVRQAREALAGFNGIREAVKELKASVKGDLRLGVIPSVAPYLLHRFLPGFLKNYPEVNLTVREMFTRDMETALRKDDLDIGLLAAGFTDPKEIDEETLFLDRFYLYASERHPLFGPGKADVRAEEIDPRKLMLLSDGHCLRSQVLDLCRSGHNVDNLYFESGSLETILRMVDATDAVTIVPEMTVALLPAGQRAHLRGIAGPGAFRRIALATGRTFAKRTLRKALREALLDACPEFVRDDGGEGNGLSDLSSRSEIRPLDA